MNDLNHEAEFQLEETFDIPKGGSALTGYVLKGTVTLGMFIVYKESKYLIVRIDSYDHELNSVTSTDRDLKEDVPLNVGLVIEEKINEIGPRKEILKIVNE